MEKVNMNGNPQYDEFYPDTPQGTADLNRSDTPSPERFFLVGLGLEHWTNKERKVIARNPELREYEKKMKQTAQNTFGALIGPWTLHVEPKGKPRSEKGKSKRDMALVADGDNVVRFVNPKAKMVLRVFRNKTDPQNQLYSIQFTAGRPAGRFSLFSGNNHIPLDQEFDDDNYATVREADFASVLKSGELTVRPAE